MRNVELYSQFGRPKHHVIYAIDMVKLWFDLYFLFFYYDIRIELRF